MGKHKRAERGRSARLSPEPDEVGAAVRDTAFRLTHDLSDTPADLRDAAALAPLAAIKLARRCADAIAARPKRAVLLIAAAVAAVLTGVAALRRARS